MNETPDKQQQRLEHGYNRMLEHIRANLARAGGQARPALSHLIDAAREKIIELEVLTVQEADRIAEYLGRDLHDAAEYLAGDDARELADWFRFDIRLIEDKLLELFVSVADPTRLELLSLEERAEHGVEFHTGEITGPGALKCLQCGKAMHFHQTGHIPPCPACHHTVFSRG